MIGENDDYWDDEYVNKLQLALKDAVDWILHETSDWQYKTYVKKEWVDLLPEKLKLELEKDGWR